MSQTTYADIKAFSQEFKQTVQDNPGLPFSQEEMPLVIFIDNDELLALMNVAPKLAIIPCMENGKLTFSLLGVTADNKVLPAHINGTLDGQETWPDGQLIKYSQIQGNPGDPDNVYNQFFK